MDQLDKLKDDVLESEEAGEAMDEFKSFADKYGDFFMAILRFVIYCLTL